MSELDWDEEIAATEAIFGECFQKLSANEYKVSISILSLDPPGLRIASGTQNCSLRFFPPLVLIFRVGKFEFTLQSDYIPRRSLSLLCEAFQNHLETVDRGSGMLFSLVTWLSERAIDESFFKDISSDGVYNFKDNISFDDISTLALPKNSLRESLEDDSSEIAQQLATAVRLRKSGASLKVSFNSETDETTTATTTTAMCPDDLRADSRVSSRNFQEIVSFLIDWDSSARNEDDTGIEQFECSLCFDDELRFSECHRLASCCCLFCRSCISEMVRLHVREGNVFKLVCPACKTALHPRDVRILLPDEASFERYERLSLAKGLEGLGDTLCPQCDKPVSSNTKTKDGDMPKALRCAYCTFCFCARCRKGWHGGTDCKASWQQALSLDSKEGCDTADAGGKEKERPLTQRELEEKASLKLLSIGARAGLFKPCGHCGQIVEKISGCNKVVCGYCRKSFCFHCGQAIDNSYGHFGPACELFTDRGGARALEALNAVGEEDLVANNFIQLEEFLVATCPCCLEALAKLFDDNLLRCPSCNGVQVCALCKERVWGPWHYNEYHKRRTTLDEDVKFLAEVNDE